MGSLFRFLIIVSSLFSVISCSDDGATPDGNQCQRFTTGTFKYEGSEDIRVERTPTEQIEYNLDGNGSYIFTDRYAIHWVNDCEYYLTLKETDHPNDLNFSTQDTMWCKITLVGRKSFNFTAVKNGSTFQGKLILSAY